MQLVKQQAKKCSITTTEFAAERLEQFSEQGEQLAIEMAKKQYWNETVQSQLVYPSDYLTIVFAVPLDGDMEADLNVDIANKNVDNTRYILATTHYNNRVEIINILDHSEFEDFYHRLSSGIEMFQHVETVH